MRSWLYMFGTMAFVFSIKAFSSSQSDQGSVHREEVVRLDSEKKVVELYWAAPRKAHGKLSSIIYVHGVQDQSRPGAINLANSGMLSATADLGVFAAAMSMPGYGGSSGDADFCGRESQVALRSALKHLRSRPDIDPRKIAVSGISCGATVAAMVADKEQLAAMILVSGVYDFQDMYNKWHTPDWQLEPDVLRYIEKSVAADGNLKIASEYRSSLSNASRFKTPVLLIAGTKDRIVDSAQSASLARALQSNARSCELVVNPEGGHMISSEDWVKSATTFLRKSLKKR